MHVIVHTHATQPIQHTHQGKDKKQVQLALNMYFDKWMWMTTSTHSNISMETMHQSVASSATPKKTIHMLVEELDEGAEPIYWL